eukprot:UN25378
MDCSKLLLCGHPKDKLNLLFSSFHDVHMKLQIHNTKKQITITAKRPNYNIRRGVHPMFSATLNSDNLLYLAGLTELLPEDSQLDLIEKESTLLGQKEILEKQLINEKEQIKKLQEELSEEDQKTNITKRKELKKVEMTNLDTLESLQNIETQIKDIQEKKKEYENEELQQEEVVPGSDIEDAEKEALEEIKKATEGDQGTEETASTTTKESTETEKQSEETKESGDATMKDTETAENSNSENADIIEVEDNDTNGDTAMKEDDEIIVVESRQPNDAKDNEDEERESSPDIVDLTNEETATKITNDATISTDKKEEVKTLRVVIGVKNPNVINSSKANIKRIKSSVSLIILEIKDDENLHKADCFLKLFCAQYCSELIDSD